MPLGCGTEGGHCRTQTALARTAQRVRGLAKRSPGHLPGNVVALAAASAESQALRHNGMTLAAELDVRGAEGAAGLSALGSIGWALKLNHLKVAASEAAACIVHQALQVTGILGYKNDTAYSVGAPLPRRALGLAQDLQRAHPRQARLGEARSETLELARSVASAIAAVRCRAGHLIIFQIGPDYRFRVHLLLKR